MPGQVPGEALDHCPLDESLSLLQHKGGDLLAHGLSHHIGLAEAVSGEGLEDQQDLVLIDDDPVGLLEDILQGRMRIDDALFIVLGLDEGGDVLHGPGAIERDHGGHIVHGIGLQLFDVAPHAAAFQLEYPRGLAGGQEAKGTLVVQRDIRQLHLLARMPRDDLQGPAQNGEVYKPQEVHLQEPQLGYGGHGELGDGYILRTAFGPTLQRHVVGEGLLGDHHPRGMGAGVTSDSLQLLGHVHEFLDGVVLLIQSGKLGVGLHGLCNGMDAEGDLLRHTINQRVGHPQRPAHVS